jgi:hypothetical protein
MRSPTRLAGLDELSTLQLTTGASGERLLDVDGAMRTVILATERDLSTSGFPQLAEGVYLIDPTASNGAVPALLSVGALNACLLQFAAWTWRLPAVTQQTAAADATTSADADGKPDTTPSAAPAPPAADGLTLDGAQRTPQFYLLGAATFGLCVAGLPFLSVGKLIMADTFAAAALPPADIALAVAGYPAIIGAASMSGRFGTMLARCRCTPALSPASRAAS